MNERQKQNDTPEKDAGKKFEGAGGVWDEDRFEEADVADHDDDAGDVDGTDKAEVLLQEIELLKDQLLRLTADFDNYRKRTLREKQEWSQYACQGMLEKLLPVVDNLDAAALAVANAKPEVKSVAEGFLMIHKQLTEILMQEGLTEIAASGEMFDPNVHDAVMTAKAVKGQKDNQVVTVLRKGYTYKDKVLRPAMVQVAKN